MRMSGVHTYLNGIRIASIPPYSAGIHCSLGSFHFYKIKVSYINRLMISIKYSSIVLIIILLLNI